MELAVSHLSDRLNVPDDGELLITRSQLTQLLLESHRKSINSAEEVMCLKEIGKINGLYETKSTKVVINVEHTAQQLEVLTDEELLQITGGHSDMFELEYAGAVEDAEFEEVLDGE